MRGSHPARREFAPRARESANEYLQTRPLSPSAYPPHTGVRGVRGVPARRPGQRFAAGARNRVHGRGFARAPPPMPPTNEGFAPRARESANEYLKNQADSARAALRVRTREPREPPEKRGSHLVIPSRFEQCSVPLSRHCPNDCPGLSHRPNALGHGDTGTTANRFLYLKVRRSKFPPHGGDRHAGGRRSGQADQGGHRGREEDGRVTMTEDARGGLGQVPVTSCRGCHRRAPDRARALTIQATVPRQCRRTVGQDGAGEERPEYPTIVAQPARARRSAAGRLIAGARCAARRRPRQDKCRARQTCR